MKLVLQATDRAGEKISIDSDYIKKNIGELVKDADLSKFILQFLFFFS